MTSSSGRSRVAEIANAALSGAASGVLGAPAMAATSKLEQLATGRAASYVPARTLAHLLRLPEPERDRWARNMGMHYLAAAAAGAMRGLMPASNLRGPLASLVHANLRLSFDQTLENATGVAAPPWTWPRDELIVDTAHKSLYALVTGAISDALIPPSATSSARRQNLRTGAKGFA
jgi:hypothetical protein